MKAIFYLKRLGAVIAMLLLITNVFSQAQPTTKIGSPIPVAGGIYNVPVTVQNFPANVGNISLVIKYDVSKLIYSGIKLNSGLVSANAVITPVNDYSGQISLKCISNTPIILDPLAPTALLTVTFTAKAGIHDATIPVTWSTVHDACSYTTSTGVSYTPSITPANLSTYYIDGNIVIPPAPNIEGPMVNGLAETLSSGVLTGQIYKTEAGMTNYVWTVSSAGVITAGAGTNSITVTWSNPTGQQSVSVNYLSPLGSVSSPAVYIINYYPYPAAIDPLTIPQFVDPVPHFAAGLRVDAKAGGNLVIKTVKVQQKTLSTGTVLQNGKIGNPLTPNAGLGNYAAYAISKDNGATFGPAMWPAQTIEAMQGNQLTVQYRNELFGVKYSDFNILADQTLLMNGYPQNGNILTDPYTGPIPMVVHLHGGEMPSNSDGGPTAWFMPGGSPQGPGFAFEASSLCTYPNQQEGTTLWYHPHDQGLTRINVYTGLAGYYFLRGKDEDALHLPGWSGDDKVVEHTPTGKTATFNGTNAYLPEIELAVQDRMFNVKGELYWPVEPTNPEFHPYWTPEFFGNVMTVNGKSWPYLSVAPRKYLFRLLDGCNARFLNLWLMNLADNTNGPKITVISTEGGFMDTPVDIMPGEKLFIAPAERPMVIIDFTGIAPGTVFTLMNDANAPYPTGDPVIQGLTDRIMQFVVNGTMVSAANPANQGTDKSVVPANLRPTLPLVKLTDFSGKTNVTPLVKRQLLLNEVTGEGGPLMVAVNNSHFDAQTPLPNSPYSFGGPTEIPIEGTVELWQIINTTVDAHPMHIHLSQWQLVSRQEFDAEKYMAAYAEAWLSRGIPNFPLIANYPGGGGPPFPYNTVNSDGAVGGNPSVTPFLTGPVIPANPEERGWKDAIKALPGLVSTYMCRFAPTDKPIDATPAQLVYPFDPSKGPGFVWHCHIIDHEDMDMMRPMPISPSLARNPQITSQPTAVVTCEGDVATFSVNATIVGTYKWQVRTAGTTVWTDITDGAPGPYSNSTTATLTINPATAALSANRYHCIITNAVGRTTSSSGALTVNNCAISGTLKYNNAALDILQGMTVTANGKTTIVDGTGAYSIAGVTSGTQTVTVTPGTTYNVGSINSTDAGIANYWSTQFSPIAHVKFLSGDVDNDNTITSNDATAIQNYYVTNQAFTKTPWSFWKAAGTITSNTDPTITDPINVTVNGTSATLDLVGMLTGDFNGSYNPLTQKNSSSALQLTYGDTRKLSPGQDFDLTIRTAAAMEIGAVSLNLNIPSDLVEVKDLNIKGSNDKPAFNVNGNALRIGWNSLTPVNLQAAGDFVTMKLKTTAAFIEGKMIKLTIDTTSMNELANGSFTLIPQATLNTDVLIGVNSVQSSLSNYPNPFKDNTTLSYTLPVSATVTLQIYNLLGVVVKNLLNATQPSGTYTVKMDTSNLQQGTYTAILRINDNTKITERTVKLVISK